MATIRTLTLDDLDVIECLEQTLFGASAWHREDLFRDIKENPFSYYYVVEVNQKIVGYCGVMILYENAEILTIGVQKDSRRCGYGKMMMTKMIEQSIKNGAENMSLEVRVSNESAISLYESFGFVKAAIRSQYYQDGEDAILMIKRLEVL